MSRLPGSLAVVSGLLLLAAPIAPASNADAAAVPQPVQQVPETIDSTGTRDVTAELQAFIDQVPDGGTVRLRKAGRYRLDETLLLRDRRDLTVDGNGAQIFAATTGDGDRSHLRIVGGAGIVINDLEILGVNPLAGLDDRVYQVPLVGQHGIRLEGATHVELARVHVFDVYGDFVYLGPGSDGGWSQGVWIHDSVFARSGRQGLTVTAGRDVVIERNVITDTRRATVDLEPNASTWGAENVHILDNQVGPGRLLFVAAGGGGPVDRVVVARNQLRGHILNTIVDPPSSKRRRDFYFVDNTSDTPATRSPLSFTRVDGLVVEGNRQPMVRPGEAAVSVNDVCGVVVTGNDLSPGTLQLDDTQAPCGTAPSMIPPVPPSAAGRPVSRAPSPTTTTTISTTTTTTRPAPPPVTTDDGGGIGRWALVALLLGGLIAAIALLVWELARRRAARRRTAERRTASWRPSQ